MTSEPSSTLTRNLPRAGETFGRFQVLELLGRGGMGQIFRVIASDKPNSEPMALKVIDSPNLSRVDRLRFEREFHLTSQFDHPNLVKVHEFGTISGITYYTMEWVKGVDIDSAFARERKARGGGELPECAVEWIGGVLSGLRVLHEGGIVHRDLKPENVLIDIEGRPKLLDLGLASHFSDERSVSRLTVPGAVLGTIHYMAPEQVIGAEVDPRADLYSLGVILYHWFSDRLPFTGTDPIAVLGQILHEAPPKLEPVLQLPQAAISLVESLLSKKPEDRPSSAGQVRAMWKQAFGSISDSAERELVSPSLKALPLPPRFVGRERALDEVQQRLTGNETQGLSVVFTGAAGMGKSKALAELRDWAKKRRWKVLSTGASPLDTLPFQPLLDPIRASLRHGLPPDLESFRPELSLILPELSLDQAGPVEPDLNPMRRYRLFEGMRRTLLFDRRRSDEPVSLLSFEELQYAGDETLEFLHFLKQRQEVNSPTSLLVVASLGTSERPEPISSRLEQTLASSNLLKIELGPLDQEAARRLILSMLGGGNLEELSLRAFVSQSEGNPLFLIEMTRAFLEEGRLQRQRKENEDVWRLQLSSHSAKSTASSKIPDTLKSVVARRLRPLDSQDRELLKKAAFLGMRFSFPLLAGLLRRPESEVLDRLLALAGRGLVKEGKGSDTFDFCNSVIPAVLLDSTQPSEKRSTHLAICREALAQSGDQCDPFWLAWHYREAGEEGEAIRHLLTSADRALNSFSFAQAAALYRELLSSGEELERLGINREDLEEKCADAARHQGELAQAATAYESLLRSQDGSARRLRLMRKLALTKDAQGDSAGCFALLKSAWSELALGDLEDSQGSPNLLDLLKALSNRRLSLSSRSKVARLSAEQKEEMSAICAELQRLLFFLRPAGWVQQAVNVALTQRQVKPSTEDPLGAAQSAFSGAYLCLRLPKGWQTQSLRYLDSAIDKLAQAPLSFQRLDLQRDLAYLYYVAGRPERGLELFRQVAEHGEQLGHLTSLPSAYALSATALITMAEFEQAVEVGWKGYHLAQALENRRDLLLATCQLVRAMIYLGRWDDLAPLYSSVSEGDFDQFPYLRVTWLQLRVEKEIWEGKPGGVERAEALALEGIALCADLDELRYYKASLHVLLIETRLKGQLGSAAMEAADWEESERHLRPFAHLRFRLKLMKTMWHVMRGEKVEATGLAGRLLERPESNSFRRSLIEQFLLKA